MKKLICVRDMLNPSGMRTCIYKRGIFLGAQSIKEKNGKYYPVDVTQWCEITEGQEFTIVDYQNQYMVTEAVLFYFVTAEEDKDPLALSLMDGTVQGFWGEGFAEEFEKDHGYTVFPYLYALFYEPLTEAEEKARKDYLFTLNRLYPEAKEPELKEPENVSEQKYLKEIVIPPYTKKNVITGTDDMTFEAKGGNMLPISGYEVYDTETNTWRRGSGKLDFPKGLYLETGQNYRACAKVYFEHIPAQIYLQIEKDTLMQLKINGKEVDFHKDAEANVPTGKYLQKGYNTVEIIGLADAAAVTKRLPRLCFRGRFLVEDGDRAAAYREFISFGSLDSQGYPYLDGEGIYRTRINVYGMNNDSHIRPWHTALLCCHADGGAGVYVNGIYAGAVTDPEEKLDVTKMLHANTNEITVVTGRGILQPITIELYK